MPPPSTSNPWLPLAHLLRPQGRRGELLAEPLTDLPNLLTPGREVALVRTGQTSPAPDPADLHIESAWSPTGKNAGRIVLKLSGCDTISQAEALAGSDLLIRTADLPRLDPDTFFVADLLGCELYDGPALAGVIVDLHFPTTPDGRRLEDAAPLLAIQPTQSTDRAPSTERESPLPAKPQSPLPAKLGLTDKLTQTSPPDLILIPFVRAWLDSVDLPSRRITMHLPPGLLD